MPTSIITDNTSGGTHAGTEDASIFSAASGSNFGGASPLECDSGPVAKRFLIRVTSLLTAVPSGATITAVRIRLYSSNTGFVGGPTVLSAYRCTRAWVEAQVTWNSYATALSWATAGGRGTGDAEASASGTATVNDATAYYDFASTSTLIADVQGWLDGATSGDGWIFELAGPGGDWRPIGSEGTDGQRPIIEIDYTTGPPAPRVNPAWGGRYGRRTDREVVRMHARFPSSESAGLVGIDALYMGEAVAGSHTTTGALAADVATVAGTATHRTLHATSGALAAQAASVAGSADHRTLHATSGALSAQSASVAGAAAHHHVTTGALSAQSASVAGAAAHLTLHTTSGALSAQSASVAGAAAHAHAATGALAAQDASVAGTATHTEAGASHSTTGALTAQDASVSGTADHRTIHSTSGALSAQAASVSGAAVHPHITSGSLTAQSASIAGVSANPHVASGALQAQSASVSGDATHEVPTGDHATVGALLAGEASVSGVAERIGLPSGGGGGTAGLSRRKRRQVAKLVAQRGRDLVEQRQIEEEEREKNRKPLPVEQPWADDEQNHEAFDIAALAIRLDIEQSGQAVRKEIEARQTEEEALAMLLLLNQ